MKDLPSQLPSDLLPSLREVLILDGNDEQLDTYIESLCAQTDNVLSPTTSGLIDEMLQLDEELRELAECVSTMNRPNDTVEDAQKVAWFLLT